MVKRDIIKNKTKSDENFPVGSFFIPKKYRTAICSYYNLARIADDIADDCVLSDAQKLTKLEELEQAFLNNDSNFPVASKLKVELFEHNLSTSLVTDLFVAFRQDAEGKKYLIWEELLNYCSYSAATVGRFMLALFNESPTTYYSSTALCTALQIINHVQDVKDDLNSMGRLYIPQELITTHNVDAEDLRLEEETANITSLKLDIMDKVDGLMEDANLLPMIIRNYYLKLEVCIIISLTYTMVEKIKASDILSKKIKFSKLDWLKSFVKGLIMSITIKNKTLP